MCLSSSIHLVQAAGRNMDRPRLAPARFGSIWWFTGFALGCANSDSRNHRHIVSGPLIGPAERVKEWPACRRHLLRIYLGIALFFLTNCATAEFNSALSSNAEDSRSANAAIIIRIFVAKAKQSSSVWACNPSLNAAWRRVNGLWPFNIIACGNA